MINDPWELAIGVQPPAHEEEEPEDPSLERHRIFNSHTSFRPDDTSYHNSFEVSFCRFNEKGQHVQPGKDCPHYNQVDEEGPRVRSSWTAQQGS